MRDRVKELDERLTLLCDNILCLAKSGLRDERLNDEYRTLNDEFMLLTSGADVLPDGICRTESI